MVNYLRATFKSLCSVVYWYKQKITEKIAFHLWVFLCLVFPVEFSSLVEVKRERFWNLHDHVTDEFKVEVGYDWSCGGWYTAFSKYQMIVWSINHLTQWV